MLLSYWSDPQFVPMWFWGTFAFILGLCIGSFLNVVIYRVPRGESIVWGKTQGRSFCPECHNIIAGYDNIPLLSYLLLGGKCRQCKAPISIQYPLVELLTGLLFVGAFYQFGLTSHLAANLFFIGAIIALVFIDYFTHLLPDAITLPGTVISLVVRIFVLNFAGIEFLRDFSLLAGIPFTATGRTASIINALVGMAIGGGTLWLIGVGYFRLRTFRMDSVERLSRFLIEECVPETFVRLTIRRQNRISHVIIEAGDFTEYPPELQEELHFKLHETGSPELRVTSLSGVVAEAEAGGVKITEIPDSSLAKEFQLQTGDIILRASREGMGLGDVKMMLFVGAFLGSELTFLTLLLGALLGVVITGFRFIRQGRSALDTVVPFGVLLGIGAMVALFYGHWLVNKYMNYALNYLSR
ncbi:MAG TPA: prepilin peptidase, partial [Acidobacteriota bacterium]|nr:prepilin peptidase [Acidobacteriota bacterium]